MSSTKNCFGVRNASGELTATKLGNLDDLIRLVILDSAIDIESRKMEFTKIPAMGKDRRNDYKRELDCYTSSPQEDHSIIIQKFVKMIADDSLFETFDVSPEDPHFQLQLKFYLNFLHGQSVLKVAKSDRYSLDGSRGSKIIAAQQLKRGKKLNVLQGQMAVLTEEESKTQMFWGDNDYSMMDINDESHLFLGPCAIVNHECSPNIKLFKERGLYIFKVCRNIDKDEEVSWSYGPHYFGINNQFCECPKCEKKKKGVFSEFQNTCGKEVLW